MRLKLLGEWAELKDGIGILESRLGIVLADDGFPVQVEQRPGNIEVGFAADQGYIHYDERIHFFRALGLFVEEMRRCAGGSFRLEEEPQFTMNGTMIDCSRNSVMKVESLKKTLEIMSLMGLNMLMVYTEDVYTIEGKPYFGYMRGRFSQAELRAADDYADKLGIEMIPCIQTLAHLKEALKWDYARNLRDMEDILLVGSEQTYAFIDEMIRSASAPFRSKRIHIGMDEAHNLGLGKYLDTNGFRDRFELMNEHLDRVKDIAKQHGLVPMLWSDMYLRFASPTHNFYDMKHDIPEHMTGQVPEGVQLVYWDYFHIDEEKLAFMIRKHKKYGRDVLFAGGIWTWHGVAVHYDRTFDNTNGALAVCKREGIREVFATMWGDNGSETNFFAGLLGMQLYAEHGYSKELDPDKLKRRFAFCAGGDYDAFMALSDFDRIPDADTRDVFIPSNPSKFLLWQDMLLGLFDRHADLYDFPAHYAAIAEKLGAWAAQAGEWRLLFEQAAGLASVLSLKSHLGLKISECYSRGDREAMGEIARNQLPELYRRVKDLRKLHKRQWFETYKPFGWEILDIRYGGLLARIESAGERLTDYVQGTVDRIEELEEERLLFEEPGSERGRVIGYCNSYQRIVSANVL